MIMADENRVNLTTVVAGVVEIPQKVETRVDNDPFALPFDEIAPTPPKPLRSLQESDGVCLQPRRILRMLFLCELPCFI